MARRAFVAWETKQVIHPDDKENPTVFTIQAMPYRVRQWIADHGVEIGNSNYHAGKVASLGLQLGLLNIENFHGPNGEPMDVKQTTIKVPGTALEVKCVDVSMLDLLTPEDSAWLQSEIGKFAAPKAGEGEK